MNILSEPLINCIILWEELWSPIYLKKTDSHFIQNHAALVYMLFISLLHIIKKYV